MTGGKSNVMTPERLKALTRLRAAHGDPYKGEYGDLYEMFLVVDECFRNSETEQVATWLPYTPDVELGKGEYLMAIRNMLKGECQPKHFYRIWDSDSPSKSLFAGQAEWYLPLSPSKLPAMKIQEAGE
ncbi:hypothetical protein UFOVP1004_5 [uncultured Caudovirales phage]|uniref:Uncharacterized protein n=1 Tax=uncultured Caudovirales phage TaxID=2100421 RepID=A0A6J5Q0J8_9CAUD|nr:hypothetical protein UFOVP1004_5 [uncultured Caudovirales phage]